MSNLNNNGLFSQASYDPSGFPTACSGVFFVQEYQGKFVREYDNKNAQRCLYCGSMGYIGKCDYCGADIIPQRKSF